MPDVDADDTRRGRRLFLVLFWAGVGLAPLAGLLLLLGGSDWTLRVGAVLGMLVVVLIGLSLALRPDPHSVRLQLEETLLEEVDVLRAEVREEIASAARATHQTVGERLGALQQVVDSVRAGVPPPPTVRSAPPPPYVAAPRSAPPPYVAASRSAPPPYVAAPRAAPPTAPPPVAPPVAPPRSAPPPQSPPVGRYPPPTPVSVPATGNGRASGARRSGGHRAEPYQGEIYQPAATGRAAPAGGLYQRTETVQVTTQSTYMDEGSANGDRGRRYESGYGDRGWSAPRSRGRSAEPAGEAAPYQESWTDQKLRERYGRRPRPFDRTDEPAGTTWTAPVSAEPVSRGRARRWEEERGAAEPVRYRSQAAPASGAGRHSPEPSWTEPAPDYSRRALPAAASEPSWNDGWSDGWNEPVRTDGGHRSRADAGRDGYRDTPPHQRRLDFELSDERWQ